MFVNYIKEYFNPTIEEQEIIELQETIDLYQDVQCSGGFIEVYSRQCNVFDFEEHKKRLPIFQKYLLNFEKQQKNLDGSYLERASYVEQTQSLEFQVTTPEVWLKDQVTVWQLPSDIVNKMNYRMFTFEDISKLHGQQLIDIREQDPNTDTFQVTSDHDCSVSQLKIEEYCKYLNNKIEFLQKNPQYSKDKVLQAVNINMNQWDEETIRFFEYMPQSLLKYDGFVYLRQFYSGVNVPKMYMNTKGCWIGGRQEHSAVNSLNFNHGPDDCVWFTIDAQYVDQLHQLLPNLYQIEGKWFKNIEFFLQNKIPIKQTIQRKGDLMILGAGCLFWWKSLGNAINTSWDLLLYSENSFNQIYKRQQINQQYNIKSLIPIKNLLLDVYLHKNLKLLTQYLEKFIIEEIQEFQQHFHKSISLKKKFDFRDKVQCDQCKMEIFIYLEITQDELYRCLKCIDGENVQLYMKYKPTELLLALKVSKINCSESLCSSYLGNTDCQLSKQQEDQISFNSKESEQQTYSEDEKVNMKFTKTGKTKTNKKHEKQIVETEIKQVDEQKPKIKTSNSQKKKVKKRNGNSDNCKIKSSDDIISEIYTLQKQKKQNEYSNFKQINNYKQVKKENKILELIESSSQNSDSYSIQNESSLSILRNRKISKR